MPASPVGPSMLGTVGHALGAALLQRKIARRRVSRAVDPNAPAGGGRESHASKTPSIDVAQPGIHKPGFIDNSDGANLRTGPAELGGSLVRPQPLPPAAQVFVSGTHPKSPDWWYVTAQVGGEMSRGFVQQFRITTALPEPTARLYAIQSGDTIERIAAQRFGGAARPGHDLRYYENVVLSMNQAAGRKGVKGTFQDPGLLGGGANNIQLEAGHRIWLPSPAYAKSVEGSVPSGSLTGGHSQAGSFGGHAIDLMRSVSEAPRVFRQVAGQYADAIIEHLPEIVGIIGAVLAAESLSISLAASPTGVSQVLALAIQAGLTAFGVTAAVETAAQALEQGQEWLRLAWDAKGQPAKLVAASRAFCRMVVAIALAALAVSGAAGSAGKAAKIAKNLKVELPPMPPAMALAGGGTLEAAGTLPWPKVTTGGPLDLSSQMSGLKGVPGDATRGRGSGDDGAAEPAHNGAKDADHETKVSEAEQDHSTSAADPIVKGSPQSVRRWMARLRRISTPSKAAHGQYEIKVTGPANFEVPAGSGTIMVDGIEPEAACLLEAKYVETAGRSPFVEGSRVPEHIRAKIVADVEDEFSRYAAALQDPRNPVVALRVIVSDAAAVPFFEKLLQKSGIRGEVTVIPP